MSKTVEATYTRGTLILPEPLPLPEHTHVRVTIETSLANDDFARGLAAMADDSDIQRELRSIGAELAHTESDGLQKL